MKKEYEIVSLAELSTRAMEMEFVAQRKHALRTRMILLSLAGFCLAGYVVGLAWFPLTFYLWWCDHGSGYNYCSSFATYWMRQRR